MVPMKGVEVHAVGEHQNCRAVIMVGPFMVMAVK